MTSTTDESRIKSEQVSALQELSPRTQDSFEENPFLPLQDESTPPMDLFSMLFAAQNLISDVQRAAVERSVAYMDFFSWKHLEPKESQTVLLIPGYSANNLSVFELGAFLKAMGHNPRYAISGTNTIQKKTYDQARDSVLKALDQTGEPVTILGHSAGGLIATILQSDINDREGVKAVKKVITAASPVAFPFIPVGQEGNPLVTQSALRAMRRDPEFQDMTRLAFTHLPAEREEGEMVAFYSLSDPIVNHKFAQRPDAHNIEVGGSHMGMPWNVNLLRHTRDILAA